MTFEQKFLVIAISVFIIGLWAIGEHIHAIINNKDKKEEQEQ